jgi:selenocysteine lyase/cysteine desulfurase
MSLNRRKLLMMTGLGAAATLTEITVRGEDEPAAEWKALPETEERETPDIEPDGTPPPEEEAAPDASPEWQAVRAQFQLSPAYIHMAGLLIAAHPAPVRAAIQRHRQGLDQNPAVYLPAHRRRLERAARQAAAQYMGVRSHDVALTDSTTMGLALVYNGIRIRPNQGFLTTTSDYYSTHESVRYKAGRVGAGLRKIRLYRSVRTVSEEEMVNAVIRAVRPKTRVVALTWVHSSTGLKVPVRRIADALARINARRGPADRVLLCVDGVHGFGVEATPVAELGCDFFMAGTHKWMFAPRGTGVIWGNPRTQTAVSPTIPTFTRDGTWGGRMTPGGFHSFEHQWAMAEAFRFHQKLGRQRVTERIHSLSRQLKEGLAEMPHVTLYTPLDSRLSAGIVCFDVKGMRPAQVVRRLRQQRVVASTTPYAPSHARLTPGIYNTPGEMEQVLRAVRSLA